MSGLGLLSRFGLAGAVNTAVGLAVILFLDIGLGIDPRAANAAGYAVGIACSFALNRSFVFRHGGALGIAAARYAAVVAFAFALNQGVLAAAGHVLDQSPSARVLAQLAAMAAYTGAVFVLSRFWVFRVARAAP